VDTAAVGSIRQALRFVSGDRRVAERKHAFDPRMESPLVSLSIRNPQDRKVRITIEYRSSLTGGIECCQSCREGPLIM
jgi:hypothetical protein